MPSISTLIRYLKTDRRHIDEGEFDFEGLLQHLQKRNLQKLLWLSEDATRIKGKIEYDSTSNQILGFVSPLKNNLPERHCFTASSAQAIESYFRTGTKASYAYTECLA